MLIVSKGLQKLRIVSTAAGLFSAGKSLQENGLIQVTRIKRKNAEQEKDFED